MARSADDGFGVFSRLSAWEFYGFGEDDRHVRGWPDDAPDDRVVARRGVFTAWSRDAIVYPDVDLASGFGFDFSVKKVAMPEYSYWKLRDKTFIDTSSAWRREALLSVGGFSARQVKYDDYELALRLTRNNWSAKRAGVSTRITQHGERRSITNNKNDALWTAYTFAFVTLFGPNADKKILLNWYARSQPSLPPAVTSLVIIQVC